MERILKIYHLMCRNLTVVNDNLSRAQGTIEVRMCRNVVGLLPGHVVACNQEHGPRLYQPHTLNPRLIGVGEGKYSTLTNQLSGSTNGKKILYRDIIIL